MGWNHFVYCDKRWPLCSLLLFPNWHWVLLPHWRKDYRCEMKQDDFFFPFCPPSFLSALVSVTYFYPFSSRLTPHSWSLPPPLSRWFVLSLSQCSCPLLIFSSMFFLPHHAPLSPPHPSALHPHLLYFLYYFSLCNISAIPPALFQPFSLSLSHLSTLSSMSPPSHSLPSPPVLWKLSPLWGCHAEDLSPSAPAVPPKVT